jgi:hypothetical protein
MSNPLPPDALLERMRSDLHHLVATARFSTTPHGRHGETAQNLRDQIDNTFDLIAYHL